MATITQLSSGRYSARVRRKGARPLSKTFRRKADATVWARDQEDAIDQGTHVDPRAAARTTVSDLLDNFDRLVLMHKEKPFRERSKLKLLHQALGPMALAQLTPEEVIEFALERLEDVSGGTVHKDLNTLSKAIKVGRLVLRIALPYNAAAEARAILLATGRLTTARRDRRVSDGELARLHKELTPTMRLLVPFAVETGMRRGEIVAMRRHDIKKGWLHIPKTKTGRPRTIELSDRALRLVRDIPTHIDGRVWDMQPDSVTQAFSRACQRCGLEDLRFHDLRHEAISRLFEHDLSIPEVAAISGHRTWSQLERYTHLRPSLRRASRQNFDGHAAG